MHVNNKQTTLPGHVNIVCVTIFSLVYVVHVEFTYFL